MNKENKATLATEKSEVALREESVKAFWEEHDIFKKSLETPAGNKPVGDFVFYDGPPFATGLPHYGHILASTVKDAVPRFWTMQGYKVRRQWGWDCHGLPVENLIEKKLGLATKRDIEEYGIKNFNEQARSTVMEYADEWKVTIPRLGRWADMEDDYKTMDSSYTESVWWVFSELNKKGLVFEGFKSMHLCPRCGTTLSNFEVNLGYKDIKDIAVFVTLPFTETILAKDEPQTSLLVWTTTPWTLPGNMAAAVHQDYNYAVVEMTGEEAIPAKRFLLAKDRVENVFGEVEYKVVGEVKGSDLVGKKYEPPFDTWSKQQFEGKENAWQVYHADYVELGETGTGAVHLAPAYGEEDMQLAKENGVPIVHHVDESGHFKDFVEGFGCQLVKPKDDDEAGVNHKDADIEVLKKLQEKDRLFKKENIAHSYPHCWRCDTPLLNYATTSWFVDVPSIKDKLVAENDKIHWVPEYVGTNRFGRWLEGARDWAVSRQRYWGAPLPIWQNPETKEYKIFGSLEDLQAHTPKNGNSYLLMRHGESDSNLTGTISSKKTDKNHLTAEGISQTEAASEALPKDIDVIIHSGFARTKETAEIISKKYPEAQIIEDDRIRELDLANDFAGKTWDEYNNQFATWSDRYTEELPGSENRRDVQIRMGQFIEAIDKEYKDKKILLIGHAGPFFALESAVRGLDIKAAKKFFEQPNAYLKNAEIRELEYLPIPHNDNYELDFHRPYIDDFLVYDESGTKLERIPDVFDCWFESGSMPYGQYHYPFENKEEFEQKLYPANFIAEGLDQTRGWFYSLIVLGTALFGKSPYQNVMVNGLIMAEDGKKLSKKLQNYSEPLQLANQVGADSMRFYLLSSPVVRAEDISFSDKEVMDLQRKNIGRLHNVLTMYQTYADEKVSETATSPQVLDRWIVARLNETVAEITTSYKNYELDKATRPITDLIDDLSVWYLRRSRDRLKGLDIKDKELALGTLRLVLKKLSLVMAPAMPFYAEYLFQAVKTEDDQESVHLMKWPDVNEVDKEVLATMTAVREVVKAALEVRAKSGVKTRQPLGVLRVQGEAFDSAYIPLLEEEVNVKEVNFVADLDEKVELDLTITPELQAEGDVREFVRAIQELRKEAGLQPSDRIILNVQTATAGEAVLKQYMDDITQTVGANEIKFTSVTGEEIKAGTHSFVVQMEKK